MHNDIKYDLELKEKNIFDLIEKSIAENKEILETINIKNNEKC